MTTGHRTARIEARIAPEALDIVRRAAELEGRSVSDFVVTAARDAAKRTIEANHTLHLSAGDQRRFVDLLLDPPQANAALKRARSRHDALIQKVE